jgi:hypothetical protein
MYPSVWQVHFFRKPVRIQEDFCWNTHAGCNNGLNVTFVAIILSKLTKY